MGRWSVSSSRGAAEEEGRAGDDWPRATGRGAAQRASAEHVGGTGRTCGAAAGRAAERRTTRGRRKRSARRGQRDSGRPDAAPAAGGRGRRGASDRGAVGDKRRATILIHRCQFRLDLSILSQARRCIGPVLRIGLHACPAQRSRPGSLGPIARLSRDLPFPSYNVSRRSLGRS